MEAAQIPELRELFDRDYRNIILDLRDVRLADRDAVRFLRGCEADAMKLENCPAYVREWWTEQKIERGNARILGISTPAVTARMFHPRVACIGRHLCGVLAGPFGQTPGSREEFL
jgi:hypothetical protein